MKTKRCCGSEMQTLHLEVIGAVAANSGLFSVPAVVNFGIVEQGERRERAVKLFRYDFSSLYLMNLCSGSTREVVQSTRLTGWSRW